VVYLPSDYKAGAKWPLILHFHGSGDSATTVPWLWGTNGKGYIIVGLSYVKGEGVTPVNAAAMIKYVDAVRALVDATYGVDQHRVFLSGTSMGGWAVNYCGFSPAANGRYKGYCIVAAGPAKGSGVDFSVARDLPVLVLNGETDGNLAAAKRGVRHLERVGAKVTAVVLPGEGHMPQPPKIWPPLAKWLASVDR
jgi:poly(3-hydroxybutyrate) depolymerase